MSVTTLYPSAAYTDRAPAEAKWSPRKTLLFIVGSSLTLWGLIIWGTLQII